jgi:acyl-CoA reductase-like NAD-dependent aldehyde dehydrogenase
MSRHGAGGQSRRTSGAPRGIGGSGARGRVFGDHQAAEECPATALALARALDDAGLPKGVVRMVFGVPAEVSSHLIASPVIRKMTFTVSTPVGRLLATQAAQGVKPITLELGGHAPVLVLDDADLDAAAHLGAANRFRGTGQMCISSTRFLVQRSSYEAFAEKFVTATEALKVGNGLDPSTQVGPLANQRQLDKVDALVADANRLPYGLSAYAFTTSAQTTIAVGDRLEAGMIGINHFNIIVAELPFGGVKESGYGSEGGEEGIENYLVTKFISQV